MAVYTSTEIHGAIKALSNRVPKEESHFHERLRTLKADYDADKLLSGDAMSVVEAIGLDAGLSYIEVLMLCGQLK